MPISPSAADRDDQVAVHAQVLERQRDAYELRDDGQEVDEEEAADRESAPEAAKALEDEACLADTGDGAQPHHHLLVDDHDRDQKHQRPEQGGAVVLTRLRVGGDAAGVVVADHHDQARAP